MKLTTKVRYGTRAMLELAQHYGQGPLTLAEVAAAQELSVKYVETILSSLRVSGLLVAERGSQGGYLLARPPEEITLRQIFAILDGPQPYVPCTGDPSVCHRSGTCIVQDVWARMYEASMEVLERTTLADLVARSHAARPTPMTFDI